MTKPTILGLLGRGFRADDSTLRRAGIWASTVTGSALAVATALIHYHLYDTGYRSLPVIGVLFVVQSASAGLLALALLYVRRVVTAVVGFGFMAASAVGLLVSTSGRLFGFHERFAAPYVGLALAVAVGGAAVLGLATALLALPSRRHAPTPGVAWRRPTAAL